MHLPPPHPIPCQGGGRGLTAHRCGGRIPGRCIFARYTTSRHAWAVYIRNPECGGPRQDPKGRSPPVVRHGVYSRLCSINFFPVRGIVFFQPSRGRRIGTIHPKSGRVPIRPSVRLRGTPAPALRILGKRTGGNAGSVWQRCPIPATVIAGQDTVFSSRCNGVRAAGPGTASVMAGPALGTSLAVRAVALGRRQAVRAGDAGLSAAAQEDACTGATWVVPPPPETAHSYPQPAGTTASLAQGPPAVRHDAGCRQRVRHPGFLHRPECGGSSATLRAGRRAPQAMCRRCAATGNPGGCNRPAHAGTGLFPVQSRVFFFFCPFVWPHPSAVTRIASAVRRSACAPRVSVEIGKVDQHAGVILPVLAVMPATCPKNIQPGSSCARLRLIALYHFKAFDLSRDPTSHSYLDSMLSLYSVLYLLDIAGNSVFTSLFLCIVSDVDNGYFLEFFQIWALQTGCRYAACVFYDAGMTLAVSAVALV